MTANDGWCEGGSAKASISRKLAPLPIPPKSARSVKHRFRKRAANDEWREKGVCQRLREGVQKHTLKDYCKSWVARG